MNIHSGKLQTVRPSRANGPAISLLRDEKGKRSVSATLELIAKVGQLKLMDYVRMAWPVVEPSRPFKSSWHHEAVAEHLEAVEQGQILRLAIAMPPGTTKSMIASVMFPTHLWGPGGQPAKRFLGFSHDMKLSTRDAIKSRRLMASDWYQLLWGDRFQMVDDDNQKTRYSNDQTGFRIADYVGAGTGERGDVITIDDPHEVSDALEFGTDLRALERATFWLHETLPTRVNDPETSGIVCIHHRIHQKDMIGDILKSNMGYELLRLPMEYEVDNPCVTSIGWRDPRTEEGELLFPDRFPREVVDRDKKAMTPFAVAGQFQQHPSSREGSMLKRHWFDLVNAVPADCYWVRFWDLASSTRSTSAWTAGVLMGRSRSNKLFYIKDIKRVREEGDAVRRLIRQTAAIDLMEFGKSNYTVALPQDPGQAGKVQAKDFVLDLAGYSVKTIIESGDKASRAQPFADQAEAGNVKIVAGEWNEAYLTECASFPGGDFKDQVDASSGAFGVIILDPKRPIMIGAIVGLG